MQSTTMQNKKDSTNTDLRINFDSANAENFDKMSVESPTKSPRKKQSLVAENSQPVRDAPSTPDYVKSVIRNNSEMPEKYFGKVMDTYKTVEEMNRPRNNSQLSARSKKRTKEVFRSPKLSRDLLLEGEEKLRYLYGDEMMQALSPLDRELREQFHLD